MTADEIALMARLEARLLTMEAKLGHLTRAVELFPVGPRLPPGMGDKSDASHALDRLTVCVELMKWADALPAYMPRGFELSISPGDYDSYNHYLGCGKVRQEIHTRFAAEEAKDKVSEHPALAKVIYGRAHALSVRQLTVVALANKAGMRAGDE